MGRSCVWRVCACGARSRISPLKPRRRSTHVPNRLGRLPSCASLASASWTSLNQMGLGVRARQLRAMRGQRIVIVEMTPSLVETAVRCANAPAGLLYGQLRGVAWPACCAPKPDVETGSQSGRCGPR
jgi:hypothetical protein